MWLELLHDTPLLLSYYLVDYHMQFVIKYIDI